MTSPTKAPPHLRTGRGLPACTKHPTDGGCYRRSSGRPRSYGRRDTAHRSRASVAAVNASARREFLTCRHPGYRALGSRG